MSGFAASQRRDEQMEMILVMGAIVVGLAALVPFTLGLTLYALLALSSWPFFLAVYFAAKSVYQSVVWDFGRVMGSHQARLMMSWERRPMARDTLKKTV